MDYKMKPNSLLIKITQQFINFILKSNKNKMKIYSAHHSGKKLNIAPLYGPSFIVDKDNSILFKDQESSKASSSQPAYSSANSRQIIHQGNVPFTFDAAGPAQFRQLESPVKSAWKNELKTNNLSNPEGSSLKKHGSTTKKEEEKMWLNEELNKDSHIQLVDNLKAQNLPRVQEEDFSKDMKCCAFGNQVTYDAQKQYF